MNTRPNLCFQLVVSVSYQLGGIIILSKWILLYNCDLCNTNGIVVRLADDPWGPWYGTKIVFDPADGYRRFVHQPGQDNLVDKERDDQTNPFDLGYGYGPYQMAPYAIRCKGSLYKNILYTIYLESLSSNTNVCNYSQ